MGRILAIDYGTKRTGLAVTDVLQIIPGGLTTVATHELFTYLAKYFEKEPVDVVVVGYPTNMDGTESENITLILVRRGVSEQTASITALFVSLREIFGLKQLLRTLRRQALWNA